MDQDQGAPPSGYDQGDTRHGLSNPRWGHENPHLVREKGLNRSCLFGGKVALERGV